MKREFEIEKRIEVRNGREVIKLDQYEAYFLRTCKVKSFFALICMQQTGFPTEGYFFCDATLSGQYVNTGSFLPGRVYGASGHDPLHAVRILIPDLTLQRNDSEIRGAKFATGVLKANALRGHRGFSFGGGVSWTKSIPYWQAELWRDCNLATPPSDEMLSRLKQKRTLPFTPIGDVTDVLTSTQKVLLVVSLLYGYWEEIKATPSVRTSNILKLGLFAHLTDQSLKNFCGNAGLNALSRSRLFERLQTIVNQSSRFYSANPNKRMEAEAFRLSDSIFTLPSERAPKSGQ